LLHRLPDLRADRDLPARFPSPFSTEVHPLARQAAIHLQERLDRHSFSDWDFHATGNGKMFGVCLVQLREGSIAYLAAFSGMLAGQWQQPGYVGPVFDTSRYNSLLNVGDSEIKTHGRLVQTLVKDSGYQQLLTDLAQLKSKAQHELSVLRTASKTNKSARAAKRSGCSDPVRLAELELMSQRERGEYRRRRRQWRNQIESLDRQRLQHEEQIKTAKLAHAEVSRQLQQTLFNEYTLAVADGSRCALISCFGDRAPPSGTGDCAAVKLLHYANQNGYQPLCLAEFWWGAPPAGGLRRHRHYYPACRGKCGPVLPRMLRGIEVAPAPHEIAATFTEDQPTVVYEDEWLVVVEKPNGMLSVPGKSIVDSVNARLQARYRSTATYGAQRMPRNLLVHRLDQATSGLLVAAKTPAAFANLQQQFEKRLVKKRYLAVVEGQPQKMEGTIELPLRVDLHDRPRQLVCFQHGKHARTDYRVVCADTKNSRIEFTPVTGRTHQLRVHAAHAQGLATPIVGDELYGMAADRLKLHAAFLRFTHPSSGQTLVFESAVPF